MRGCELLNKHDDETLRELLDSSDASAVTLDAQPQLCPSCLPGIDILPESPARQALIAVAQQSISRRRINGPKLARELHSPAPTFAEQQSAISSCGMKLEELSAAELGQQIAAGQLSSRQVTHYFLDRIEQLDARLSAFVHVDRQRALADADNVDKRIQQKATV